MVCESQISIFKIGGKCSEIIEGETVDDVDKSDDAFLEVKIDEDNDVGTYDVISKDSDTVCRLEVVGTTDSIGVCNVVSPNDNECLYVVVNVDVCRGGVVGKTDLVVKDNDTASEVNIVVVGGDVGVAEATGCNTVSFSTNPVEGTIMSE